MPKSAGPAQAGRALLAAFPVVQSRLVILGTDPQQFPTSPLHMVCLPTQVSGALIQGCTGAPQNGRIVLCPA